MEAPGDTVRRCVALFHVTLGESGQPTAEKPTVKPPPKPGVEMVKLGPKSPLDDSSARNTEDPGVHEEPNVIGLKRTPPELENPAGQGVMPVRVLTGPDSGVDK